VRSGAEATADAHQERCPLLSFETDAPELYRGKRFTTCPRCADPHVEILSVVKRTVHVSEHSAVVAREAP
jgi:hypothetical protein